MTEDAPTPVGFAALAGSETPLNYSGASDADSGAGGGVGGVETLCKRDMDYFHGHGRIEYNTPQWLFHALNMEFGFTLDAAASKENAKCKRYYSEEDDGLSKDWTDEVVWLNPPYGSGR